MIFVDMEDIPPGEEVPGTAISSQKLCQTKCHHFACKIYLKPKFQVPTYFPIEVIVLGKYLY